MKKIFSILVIISMPLFINAQGNGRFVIDKEIFNICATIFTLGLFMLFVLELTKRAMDYRIKNRIAEKGIPESIASSILQANPKEDRNTNIKWFAILAGMGAGLTIIYYTLPLGIHSLAIMSFCISASFLGYFFFLKRSGK